MRRAASITALLALALAGCPGDPGGDDPDARPNDDGGGDEDGGTGPAGLIFTFVTDPALPADVGSNVVVEELDVRLREVRAIGDAAPGDDRTRVAELALHWSDEADVPEPLAFMDAPAGIYSRLELRLDATESDFSYRINGHTDVAGTDVEFEIEDTFTIPLSIPLSGVELAPGETVTVTIAIDVDDLVADLDWSIVPPDAEGHLNLGPADPQIDLVRTAWLTAIRQR